MPKDEEQNYNGGAVKKDVFQLWTEMMTDKVGHVSDMLDSLVDKVQEDREKTLREFGEIKNMIVQALADGKACVNRELKEMRAEIDAELKAMKDDVWKTKLKVFALWLGASGAVSVFIFLIGYYITKGKV